MVSTNEVHNARVYVRNPKNELKKLGRIRSVVFHPTELRAIGYIIHRPDALLMIKRKERFVAIDCTEYEDNCVTVIDATDAWDTKACMRLNVDLDACILWEYMPVRNSTGKDLGIASNVVFNDADFSIEHIDISSNAIDRKLLGSAMIPRNKIIGYEDGAIVVDDSDEPIKPSGGVAANAGTTWAKAKHVASGRAKKAEKAIDEGAYKTGEAIGTIANKVQETIKEHQDKTRTAKESGEYTGVDKAANIVGKQVGRASGMFKGFKDEFDKANRGE